jgi:hypothetical protein
MILNNAPANEAVISNVAEIGEFRIRNSAKAFSILSSGLYANKIRAVIRELSCNAVDSHAAADKRDTPFDVHLPNTLEPWFSIRDYGTGLSHQQVTQIYTTYFESTKTASNDFIGALGLGSKSPFSYTDNFTVTAIQNGRKGIYTSFINDAGVPSIAQMMEEDTDEPTGVEVRFAVNERYDFDKFRQEARIVYTHFALRPVISGNQEFHFVDAEYESRDIVPGVHSYKNGRGSSVAIMGNIAYPIDIPAADQSIDRDVRALLGCGLEMHFGIGELDFQASREGLSYIPGTIEAIKRKLESVNAALTSVLAVEANAIENLWDRACFLFKKKEHRLWTAAVSKYAQDTALPTYSTTRYHTLASFDFKVDDLAVNYNIVIKRLSQVRHNSTISNCKTSTEYAPNHAKDANGHYITWQEWQIAVDDSSHFIINDLKTGASERVRYHYKETGCNVYSRAIWILEKADKTKDMDTAAFFAALQEPPTDRRFAASTLKQRERAPSGVTKDATILRLEQRNSRSHWYSRQRDKDMVWRDAGSINTFDKKTKFYYVPLNGFSMQSSNGYTSGKELYEDVSSYPGLKPAHIYGVRKSDIEVVKKRKNWINFEDHITKELASRNHDKLLLSLVKSSLQDTDILSHRNLEILEMIDANSPYAVTVNKFKDVEAFDGTSVYIKRLFQRFCPATTLNPDTLLTKHQAELDVINKRYPLITSLSSYRTEPADIAEYISLIDEKKGI